jgi:hypothetical protein
MGGGAQSVFVHCVFAKATADLVISFDSSGKVGGLHVANIQPTGPQGTRGTPGITPKAVLIRVLTRRPLHASWFAPSFLLAVSIGQIEQGIASLTTALGPYKGLSALPGGGYQVQFRDGTRGEVERLLRQHSLQDLSQSGCGRKTGPRAR